MKPEKVARMVEGVDLSTAIFMLGGEAGDAFEQYREMRQIRPIDDGLTAVYSAPHLHELPQVSRPALVMMPEVLSR